MGMGTPGTPPPMPGTNLPPTGMGDGSDMDADSFAATDAAAGPNELGRERR